MPTRVRSRGRFTPERVIDSPSTTRSPSWIFSRPFTQRMSVLLPEPDGPHTTTTSPGVTASRMPLSTCSLPYHLPTSLNSMTGAAATSDDHHQDVAGVHGLADSDRDLLDRPRGRRPELVLHLHRLDNDQRVTAVHDRPRGDGNVGDFTWKGGDQRLSFAPARGSPARPDGESPRLLHAKLVELVPHPDHEAVGVTGDGDQV